MGDPLFGKTWKMNPSASMFSTNFTPESETRLYEEIDGGYKLTVSGNHNGTPYSWNYTALYDGKPHKVNGRKDVDSITIYKVNDRITIGFFEQDRLPGGPYARRISEDGSKLLVEAAGRHPDGTPFYDMIEYTL
ncbi:hypothetical protein ACHMW5_35940 (plasmid) [Azospirillum melinis]|uniref:hypothetical protein n=1 Tax=Azospirillum melinis TaxID=328839 RepID=UPI0037579A0E